MDNLFLLGVCHRPDFIGDCIFMLVPKGFLAISCLAQSSVIPEAECGMKTSMREKEL